MKNQKLMVNQKFFDQKLRSFQSNFFWKCSETDEAWILGLKLLAMPVSVNMSWPGETTEKFNK